MFGMISSRFYRGDKFNKWAARFEEEHPLMGILLFQVLVAVLLIAAVSGIAFAGGGIIWLFYNIVSAM